MLIIIDDKIQESDAPNTLKSPALSDTYTGSLPVAIDLGASFTMNAIGIGYTDAKEIYLSDGGSYNETITLGPGDELTGLYEIPTLTDQNISIDHDGTYIGRVAIGLSREIFASPTMEAGFYTTQTNRLTASGQVIPGAGGFIGRRISLDFRYKITEDIFNDINASYQYIARGFPWFMKFSEKELKRMPYKRLYASPDDPNLLLQTSINRFLYSKQFDFKERF